jgi:hypothetical protein
LAIKQSRQQILGNAEEMAAGSGIIVQAQKIEHRTLLGQFPLIKIVNTGSSQVKSCGILRQLSLEILQLVVVSMGPGGSLEIRRLSRRGRILSTTTHDVTEHRSVSTLRKNRRCVSRPLESAGRPAVRWVSEN